MNTFDTFSNDDLLDLIYDQLCGGVALMDTLDDAIQAMLPEDREESRVGFAVLQAALDEAGRRQREAR